MEIKEIIQIHNPCNDAKDYLIEKGNYVDAWNDCHRGDWMLWIALRLKVDHRKLTLAKALCAETVIHLMKDDRSKKAVEVAKLYGNNKATKEVLSAAAYAAYAASYSASSAASYSASDSSASYAAYSASSAASYSAYASASYSAYAAAGGAAASYASSAAIKNRKLTAKICRDILTNQIFQILNK